MSQPIDDGGPAFPHGEIVEEMRDEKGKTTGHRVYDAQPGMSLRDWLAGQEKIDPAEDFNWDVCEALAGPRPTGDWLTNPLDWFRWEASWRAAMRYARADAMLAARNRRD